MKNKLITYTLRFTKMLAGIRQLGNPGKRSPQLNKQPAEAHRLQFDFSARHQVNLWKLENALCTSLYGGAVIDSHNKMYERFSQFPWGIELHPAMSQPYLGAISKKIGKGVFLITPEARNNYYHWMVDLLPRLLLAKKYSLQEFQGARIILHSPARDYEDQTLALAGVSPEQVIRLNRFELIQAEQLLVPDYEGAELVFPEWKKQLLNEFKTDVLGYAKKVAHRKIYLVRGKQRTRQLIGEDHLIQALEEKGFEAIDPQLLTLKQQMKVLSEASVVVALHGAALTNLVFCLPGTQVIEIRNNHDAPEYFRALSKVYGLHFETLGVRPRKEKQRRIHSNRENLILTQEDVERLIKMTGNQLCKLT